MTKSKAHIVLPAGLSGPGVYLASTDTLQAVCALAAVRSKLSPADKLLTSTSVKEVAQFLKWAATATHRALAAANHWLVSGGRKSGYKLSPVGEVVYARLLNLFMEIINAPK